MRVSSYAVARPAYYDRNATATNLAFASTEAPHTTTTRFTVTVAAGKKLFMEVLSLAVYRASIATSAGNYITSISSYDGTTESNLLYDITYNNLSLAGGGPLQRLVVGTNVTVYAGQLIYATTSDNSTGGQVRYILAAKGTTFDA
jgi:hypothetical protein